MSVVAALFCTPTSIYKQMSDVEAYDIERDARSFDLCCPVVAHPPCRAWGQLSHFAKPRRDEKDLARWAVHVVRHCGGVLEHPVTSRLWCEIGVRTEGVRDRFGGVFIRVHQSWWGHRAQKHTGLYIVGPVLEHPFDGPAPTRVCQGSSLRPRPGRRAVQGMGAAERMRTPPELAKWLVFAARGCNA